MRFGGLICAALLCGLIGCDRADPAHHAQVDSKTQSASTSRAEAVPAADRSAANATATPAKDAAALRADAERSLAAGNHRAALAAARDASRIEPDDPANSFTLATVLSAQHRYHEAVRTLDGLAQRVSDAGLPVLGQTAEWLVLQGDWKSAEARFRQVLKAAPEAAIAHRQLAQLLLRQGRRAEAAGHLRQLCRLGDISESELLTLLTISQPLAENVDRETAEPIGALGEAWSLVSQQRWADAIERLQPAAEQTVSHYGLLGRIHAERDDSKALSDWYADIPTPSWQTAPELQLAIGANQLVSQEYAAAIKSLKLAVQYDESDRLARSLLAESLRQHGDKAEHEKTSAEAEAISRTQTLAAEIQASSTGKAARVRDLIAALQSLERPLEVFAWQVLQTIYQSDMSDEAKQQRIHEINAQRLQMLSR